MNRCRRNSTVLLTAMLLLLAMVFLSACSPRSNAGPGTGAPESPKNAPTERKIDLAVYYIKMTATDAYLVREVHQVPYTREAARAALEELINADPVTPGATRVIPPGTKIRGLNIRDGLATVDFSREVLQAGVGATGEALGIQSIVNTLTEFPGVREVSFLVEGKLDQEARDWWGHVGLYGLPFKRNISMVHEPVIWLTAPQPDQKAGTEIDIKGTARVYEATVNARVVAENGRVLSSGFATATEGAPGRGEFELRLPVNSQPPGKGKVEVFWISPKDGSEQDKVIVPIFW